MIWFPLAMFNQLNFIFMSKADIDVLKCNADFDKIYYIEYAGAVRQCKLIGTAGVGRRAWYILNVAGAGEVKIEPYEDSSWWYSSKRRSILAETAEDVSRGKFIEDSYGSTFNGYNYGFIKDFFPNYNVCGCGGGIGFWRWNGIRPTYYSVCGEYSWHIDRDGFHCSLNDISNRFPTEQACRASVSRMDVVEF